MAMEDQRHPKRPKICRGDDDYMPGNIIKIELCNFMTFDKLTCKPSSRLNLVIGPNGAGKSSLVCAIALGLGGEPQLLGRATSVGAYVKRGEESGYINICLRGEKKEAPISITRKIDTRNKSEWLLNGKSVAKKEIHEMIQRFNIQVNNLTQFLPQDRVCEFAKLTPVQLLEETEKAVGDPQLPVLHHSLITKSQELKKFERSVESNKGTLDQLMAQNAELEKDVERVRQREDYLAKAESMKKKLPWLKYDMKKAEYLEAKEQEKEALLKVTEAADAAKELNRPIELKKKEKAELDGECKKVKGLLDVNMKKRQQLVEDDSRLVVLIKGKYNEVDELRSQEETRQHRISKAKENLAAAEVELSNIPPYERPMQKMEQLKAQIMELEEAAREMRTQKSEKEKQLNQHRMMLGQCTNRLREMADAKNKRLSALKNAGVDKIFQAYEWVNQHRDEFKGETYGPLLLEVNVSDQFHADCLEGQVPNYVWKTFLVEDSRDRDFLFHGLKHFNVPVSNYPKDINGRHIKHFHATNEMKALSISARLDHVFEAPDLVTGFLIDHCNLDNAYIGSKETDNKADEARKVGIMNLWTPENHYQWSKSRYGNHVSGNVNAVQQSRLLRCNVDAGEIEKQELRKVELEEKIYTGEASLKDLQVTIRQNENATGKLHHEREDLVNMADIKRKQLKDAENLVSKRRKILESMEKDDDSDTTIAKLMDEAKKLKMRRFQCAIKIKDLLVEAVGHHRKSAEVNFCSYELEVKIKDMESSVKQQEDLVRQADDKYKQCKAEVVKFREKLAASKSHAESIAVLTPELKKDFEKMPTTVEDLEAAIQDIISEANSILFLNANILGEYESRQRKIEELKEKKESSEKELHDRVQEISDLKARWLPTLRSLVIRINETFSRNFQEMAVAGEVSLDEHDIDFDHYGILIKVKFRQTGQLQVLSAHHQSGGERSVSTILYLVSLQDLTNCPFRVVDEINQGMDPINERKMFQQLVRAASQLNTPQCFLLTPKLLPNLEYTEACCVLNVMNGPWIEAPSRVWSCGESWGTVSVQMDGDRS